jgi:hypothetical protein
VKGGTILVANERGEKEKEKRRKGRVVTSAPLLLFTSADDER